MKHGKRVVDIKIKTTQAIFIVLLTLILSFVAFIAGAVASDFTLIRPTYATSYEILPEVKDIKLYGSSLKLQEEPNIYETILKNKSPIIKEEITQEEEDLEFTTIYRQNSDLPKGMMQVIQEGRDGRQIVITTKKYEDEELVDETIKNKIIVASVDKIVEIGSAPYSSNYKVKVGDYLYVTSNSLIVRELADKTSNKLITINKDEKVKLLEIQDSWYKVKYNTYEGYVPSDCVTYIDPNVNVENYATGKSKAQLLSGLSKNMSLNKPSGLSLEQFKKVLSNNSQDKNKIFQNNAEYFYYIEKQYNINGVFVAAVGIHESAWGSSKIALDKRNLFGYGASDSNPYGNAMTFATYSEGIDLVARVFVKYYINSPGTSIYDGQTASGKYYNGPTLSGINKKYASDSNWHNGVYQWMSYLYNRL